MQISQRDFIEISQVEVVQERTEMRSSKMCLSDKRIKCGGTSLRPSILVEVLKIWKSGKKKAAGSHPYLARLDLDRYVWISLKHLARSVNNDMLTATNLHFGKTYLPRQRCATAHDEESMLKRPRTYIKWLLS